MGSGDQDNGFLGTIAGRSQKSLYSGRMGQAGLRGEAGGSDGTSRYRILLLTYCILSSSRLVLAAAVWVLPAWVAPGWYGNGPNSGCLTLEGTLALRSA